jgi:hypothetical protein
MIRLIFVLPLLIISVLIVTGFTTEVQPEEEHGLQNALPQSTDPMWTTLGQANIAFNGKTEKYDADFPEAIKSMAGKKMMITGFILPLESEEKFSHFLLTKSSPSCPYCPPGKPTEIIEVFSEKPTEWLDNLVTYEGTFELIDNQDFGLFYKLGSAKLVKSPK